LAEAKASLKEGCELYSIINDLLNDQKATCIKRELQFASVAVLLKSKKKHKPSLTNYMLVLSPIVLCINFFTMLESAFAKMILRLVSSYKLPV